MEKLATLYRSAQLYAHRAHNLCRGESFFQDHDFFGALYPAYEAAYDALIERMIGLGKSVNIVAITQDACKRFSSDATSSDFFDKLSMLERELRKEISAVIKDYGDGTQNLLQGLADESESRSYKIRQRIGA